MQAQLAAELLAELIYTAVICASLEVASLGALALPVAVGCVGAAACGLLVPLAGDLRTSARRLLATVSLAVLAWALLVCVCRYVACCERRHCAFFDEPVCTAGGRGDPLCLVPIALCGFRILTILPVVAGPRIRLPVALSVAHGVVGAWTLLAVPFGWVYVSLLAWSFGGLALSWLSARTDGGLRSFGSNFLLVGLHAAALAGAGLLYSRRALRVDALRRDSFAMPLLYAVVGAVGLASVARMRSPFHSAVANDVFAVLAPIPAAALPPLFSALAEEADRVFEQILKAGGGAAACFLFVHFDVRCGKRELLVYALATSALEIAVACAGLLDRGVSRVASGFQVALNIASAALLVLALLPFKPAPAAKAVPILPRLSAVPIL